MNIAEILRKRNELGDTLYSPLCGYCTLHNITSDGHIIIMTNSDDPITLESDGTYMSGECIIFPSKEDKDWAVYENETPKRIKIGEHILYLDDQYYVSMVDGNRVFIVPIIPGTGKEKWIDLRHIETWANWTGWGLKAYDKIICRPDNDSPWIIDTFLEYKDNTETPIIGLLQGYDWAVPYNAETAYLVGTKYELPDFYKY